MAEKMSKNGAFSEIMKMNGARNLAKIANQAKTTKKIE
jgi:hypothetical protein